MNRNTFHAMDQQPFSTLSTCDDFSEPARLRHAHAMIFLYTQTVFVRRTALRRSRRRRNSPQITKPREAQKMRNVRLSLLDYRSSSATHYTVIYAYTGL